MTAEGFWEPGEHVVLRNVRQARVQWGAPMTVVEDGPERTVLYLEAGARFFSMADENGQPTRDFLNWSRLRGRLWDGHGCLHIIDRDAAHAVWVFWRPPTRQFWGWYINLQEPLRRFELGFESLDQILDIQVAADLSAWRWKDEDEFELAISSGYFTPDEAAAIRSEGERAASRALNRERPFNEPWGEWAPDADWAVPELPEGWDAT